MVEKSVIGEKKGNIFYLTLNRPKKRNAISIAMLEEFCETINVLVNDPEIRVIIIKGEGSVFSAGIDFNSLGEIAGTYLSDAAGGGRRPHPGGYSSGSAMVKPAGGYRNTHYLRNARRCLRFRR